jgi:hypothetical protein
MRSMEVLATSLQHQCARGAVVASSRKLQQAQRVLRRPPKGLRYTSEVCYMCTANARWRLSCSACAPRITPLASARCRHLQGLLRQQPNYKQHQGMSQVARDTAPLYVALWQVACENKVKKAVSLYSFIHSFSYLSGVCPLMS